MDRAGKHVARGVATALFFKVLAAIFSLLWMLWIPILGFFVLMQIGAYFQWDLDQKSQNTSSKTCTSAIVVEGDPSTVINVPEEYKQDIEAAAEESGFPAQILAAQVQAESNWDPNAVSPMGARGIAQFIPSTWDAIAPGEDPFDPHASIRAQGRYMKQIKGQVEHLANGDANKVIELTLAGYNAGPGAVLQFGGIPPYGEAQNYVAKIMGASQMVFSKDCSQVSKVWDGDLGDGEWTNPCPGCVKTSSYSPRYEAVDAQNHYFHWGLDIATPGLGKRVGVEILAPTKLKITDWYPVDGCLFATAADGGPEFGFSFCHLHEAKVSVGQEVEKGTILGLEGGTAQGQQLNFDSHLHLEIFAPGFEYLNFGWFNARTGADNHGGNLNPEPILIEKGAMPGM